MKLGDLKVPGPTRTALTEPFWKAAAQQRFVLQQCADCERWVFYPRRFCPNCWSPNLDWQGASGRGTLKTWSIIHRPGHPGWELAAPYTIGLVELAEGPTMLSHIVAATPSLHMPLRVCFVHVGAEILPCFEFAA